MKRISASGDRGGFWSFGLGGMLFFISFNTQGPIVQNMHLFYPMTILVQRRPQFKCHVSKNVHLKCLFLPCAIMALLKLVQVKRVELNVQQKHKTAHCTFPVLLFGDLLVRPGSSPLRYSTALLHGGVLWDRWLWISNTVVQKGQ